MTEEGKMMEIDEDGKNDPPSGLTHTCSACGKRSAWGPDWSWYGSWKEYEEGAPIFKACSDACMAMREKAEKRNEIKRQNSELQDKLKNAMKEVKRIKAMITAINNGS